MAIISLIQFAVWPLLIGWSSACCPTETTTETTTAATTEPSPTGLGYPVVDTGVDTCYGNVVSITCPNEGSNFYGQDAQYSGYQPSYTSNGDDTVTDEVTGLMWSKEMTKTTLTEAESLASSMTLGGHTDWRLPTIKELYSLTLFTGNLATSTKFIDTAYFDQPTGDTASGEREIDAQTLSATTYLGLVFTDTECNFGMNHVDGRIKCYPTSGKDWYFRFVRGTTVYGDNEFTDNGDQTVTDAATELTWQKQDSQSGMNWQAALAYCEDLVLAGYSDWRLPNAKELHSIVDYSHSIQHDSSPAIDTSVFDVSAVQMPDGYDNYPYYWTSTTFVEGDSEDAVYISFGEALGQVDGEVVDVHGCGAQRSDPKEDGGETFPQYYGPQGDLQNVDNYARCVRGSGMATA